MDGAKGDAGPAGPKVRGCLNVMALPLLPSPIMNKFLTLSLLCRVSLEALVKMELLARW